MEFVEFAEEFGRRAQAELHTTSIKIKLRYYVEFGSLVRQEPNNSVYLAPFTMPCGPMV